MAYVLKIGTSVETQENGYIEEGWYPTDAHRKLNAKFSVCLRLRKIVANHLVDSWTKSTTKKMAKPKWADVSSMGQLREKTKLVSSAPVFLMDDADMDQSDWFDEEKFTTICEAFGRAIQVIDQVNSYGEIVQYDEGGSLLVNEEEFTLCPLTADLIEVLKKKEGFEFFVSKGPKNVQFKVGKNADSVLKSPEKIGRIARVISWESKKEWVKLEFPDLSGKLVRAECAVPERLVDFFHSHSDRHFDVHLQMFRTAYSIEGDKPSYYYILDADIFRDGLNSDEYYEDLDNSNSRWFDKPESGVKSTSEQKILI